MFTARYLLSDFVEIQRKSFFELLENGLIEEFIKRNPIKNSNQTLEIFFYPEYYKLTLPENLPRNAILKSKSYTSKLYIPVQLTDKKSKIIKLKWVCIGNLPLMTKRGHFILNGAPRVIVNQILRSPGIYYQKKLYEKFRTKWDYKPETSYKRYYADLICQRGTWLRIEMDKEKCLWAQMKKGPKIPLFWFLIGMGLTEKIIFNTISEPLRLLSNIENISDEKTKTEIYNYVKNPPEAWFEIYSLITSNLTYTKHQYRKTSPILSSTNSETKTKENNFDLKLERSGKIKPSLLNKSISSSSPALMPKGVSASPLRGTPTEDPLGVTLSTYVGKEEEWGVPLGMGLTNISNDSLISLKNSLDKNNSRFWVVKNVFQSKKNFKNLIQIRNQQDISYVGQHKVLENIQIIQELGRKWIFNKFMNPRTYDLGKLGRLNFNRKLGISIATSNCTLTPQDLLYATDYLIKVEQGLKKIDDIDHLKNRRVRTSGELLQIQIGTGLIRLEKEIREKLNNISFSSDSKIGSSSFLKDNNVNKKLKKDKKFTANNSKLLVNQFINTKALNSSLREFFGSSPLSQFMDQINPLSELTHKRRLSSMGPGGVTRDSATLAIRGIHPTHYGRICPVETPEGKNTGLVNSMTTFARVNSEGFLQSPFYKVYKGQVQKKIGMLYFSAEQEEKIKLAAADLSISPAGFLPQSTIPVRIAEDFTKIQRTNVEYIGVSSIQMISIATSLIPFLEHDDANRALMGSNMQRQAVPLIRPEKPIVGTGLEARAVSDSGHVLQAKYSGYVRYASGNKILIYSFNN